MGHVPRLAHSATHTFILLLACIAAGLYNHVILLLMSCTCFSCQRAGLILLFGRTGVGENSLHKSYLAHGGFQIFVSIVSKLLELNMSTHSDGSLMGLVQLWLVLICSQGFRSPCIHTFPLVTMAVLPAQGSMTHRHAVCNHPSATPQTSVH